MSKYQVDYKNYIFLWFFPGREITDCYKFITKNLYVHLKKRSFKQYEQKENDE